MKKLPITLLLICALCASMSMRAESVESRQANHHEIRLGWGDPIVPVCLSSFDNSYCTTKTISPGHFFIEYAYRFSPGISLGMQVDFLTLFSRVKTKPQENEYAHIMIAHTATMSVLPTIRYTYFRSDLVELYSSLGIGFSYFHVNDDAKFENVFRPKRDYTCASFDITALGVAVGKNHWYGSFELGALIHASDGADFWGPSRLISASVGYRF